MLKFEKGSLCFYRKLILIHLLSFQRHNEIIGYSKVTRVGRRARDRDPSDQIKIVGKYCDPLEHCRCLICLEPRSELDFQVSIIRCRI